MVFSRNLIRGYVLKKIENVKLGRLQNAFHKRKLTLHMEAGQTPALIMESVDS